jgi:hypothetical protein
MLLYFILTIGGMILTNILNILNIKSGQKGVDYYNEAHKSKLNKFVHMVMMPFTVYGMTILLPSLIMNNSMNISNNNSMNISMNNSMNISNNNSMNNIKNNINDIFYLELGLFLFYFNHYVNINKNVALWMIVMYLPVVYMGYNYLCFNKDVYENIIYGLKISGTSLLIQEIFGHYLGGDIPSRPEGVLNAIFYAIYSSVEYSLLEFEYSIEYFRDNYVNRFWKDDDELKVVYIKVERKNLSIIPLINKLNELDLDVIKFSNVYSYYTYNTLKNFYLSKGYNSYMNLNKYNYFKILVCLLYLILLYFMNNIYIYLVCYYNIICYKWIREIYPFNRYNYSGILIVSRYPIIEVNKNEIIVNINNDLTKIDM